MTMPINDTDPFMTRFRKLPDEDAAAGWDELWMDALQICLHGPNCVKGASCAVSKRVRWIYMLSGSSVHQYWHILKTHGSSRSGALKDRKRAREGPMFVHLQFGEHACVGVGIHTPGGDLPPEEEVGSWLNDRSQEWKENDFPTFDALFGAWPPCESSAPM